MWWCLLIVASLLVVYQLFFIHNISVEEAVRKFKEGAVLIDVRTEGEFESGYLDGAINIPVHLIATKIESVVKDKNKTILLYCHTGSRAAFACSVLRKMGYSDVYNVGSYARCKRIINK